MLDSRTQSDNRSALNGSNRCNLCPISVDFPAPRNEENPE